MGFLKSLVSLTVQGYEQQQRMDVDATFAQARASMDQASRMMTAMTPVIADPALDGQRIRTTAQVLDARQLPMQVNLDAVVELSLLVSLPGGVPMPATITTPVAAIRMARLSPGSVLDVSATPGAPQSVRVEWG